MAVLNQIQGGRWDTILRRLFSMKQGAIAPVLAGELVATVVLEDDRPENFALSGTRICIGHADLPATAVERSSIQLFNPVGSGVLAVVTNVNQQFIATGRIIMAHTITPLVTFVAQAFIVDTRLFEFNTTAIRATCQIRTASTTGIVTSTTLADLVGLVNTKVPWGFQAIILKPGTGLLIAPSGQNTANRVWFDWYERALNPSEEIVPAP